MQQKKIQIHHPVRHYPSRLPSKTIDLAVYNDRKSGQQNFLDRVRIFGISVPFSESESAVQRYPLDKWNPFSHIRGDIALRIYAVHDFSLYPPLPLHSVNVDSEETPLQEINTNEYVDERNRKKKKKESAVTWLCFTSNSDAIITASRDGSIRIWNINVRYHLDEDPKTTKVFPIPLHDSNGATLYYDRLSISPDGKILAATHSSTLQWLSMDSGKVLDTAEKAHDGDITAISWAPMAIPTGDGKSLVLATASLDKKVKLWAAPSWDS